MCILCIYFCRYSGVIVVVVRMSCGGEWSEGGYLDGV